MVRIHLVLDKEIENNGGRRVSVILESESYDSGFFPQMSNNWPTRDLDSAARIR
jgi:hypothetical protein